MTVDSEHWDLQVVAVDLWQAGKLAEARAKFEAAIAACPVEHFAVTHYRLGYAGVLTALGQSDEALVQRELALEAALTLSGDRGATAVELARYALALHFLADDSFARCLAVIADALPGSAKGGPMLRCTEAKALAGLGRLDEARTAAAAAIEASVSAPQRAWLRGELAAILGE